MLTIRIAKTEQEIIAAQKIRYKVFCEELGVFKECNRDGIEKDDDDKRSTHFIALLDGQPVGTLRLINFEPGKLFPVEKWADIPPEFYRKKAVEISRGALLKEARNPFGIAPKTIDAAYEHCKNLGLEYIFTITNEGMFLLYKKIGIPIVYEGTAVSYNGYRSFPLVFSVKAEISILKKMYN